MSSITHHKHRKLRVDVKISYDYRETDNGLRTELRERYCTVLFPRREHSTERMRPQYHDQTSSECRGKQGCSRNEVDMMGDVRAIIRANTLSGSRGCPKRLPTDVSLYTEDRRQSLSVGWRDEVGTFPSVDDRKDAGMRR